MIKQNDIKELISKMTIDTNFNLKKIKETFGDFQYKDSTNQCILHILVDEKYDETSCFLAIKSLLAIGLNPNLEDDFNYNFIQTALYSGYSEKFILKIIEESLKRNLDVNHVDSDKDTIMHTAIYSDDYLDKLENIYKLLCENGFDSTKLCHEGRTLVDAVDSMALQKQYSSQEIESFKKLFIEQTNIPKNKYSYIPKEPTTINLTQKEISELEKYGKILNKKQFITPPTIGREKELKNLIVTLAQDKKRPLIVGESGVGKTALGDELAYRIQTNQVPSFLQEKIILEVIPSELVAGCTYLGQFEEKITNLMNLCEEQDIILFIDEIHTMYGTGVSNNNKNDMATILKYYISRTNIKIIGTTTEKEYEEFFSNDALKRRFEKIKVLEPTEDTLYKIINKVIEDYYIKKNIMFENDEIKEQIIKTIISYTSKNNRVYNDMLNNPDLAISIIDKAFAFAQVEEKDFITVDHFIESFQSCDRIYSFSKERAISKLKGLSNNITKPSTKILRIDFNNYKK